MEAAASIIAFCQAASAIVKTITKAKELWDQVKEVPGDISNLMEDLEVMGNDFSFIEKQLEDPNFPPGFCDDSSAKQSLAVAKRARQTLDNLVNEMSGHLEGKKGFRRRTASFKIVIKKDTLERYEKHLQRSMNLLQTSMNSYMIAFSRSSHQVLARTHETTVDILKEIQGPLKSQLATITCHAAQSGQGISIEESKALAKTNRSRPKAQYNPSILGRFAMAYGQGSGSWRARFQWPSWISDSISEIHYCQTMAGWTYSYRVYNIVSPDSEIIRTIERGDTEGVLRLFRDRKASPFDKDHRGSSLLCYAAEQKNYDLCRHLLRSGLQDAFNDAVGTDRWSPLSVLVHRPDRRSPEKDWTDIIALFQSYLDDPDILSIGRLFDFMRDCAFDDELVLIFQSRCFLHYYSTPIRDRLEAVRLGSFCLQSPSTFLRFIDKDSVVTELDVGLSIQEKLSLLHSSAIALGNRFTDEVLPRKKLPWQRRVYFESWSDLVVQIASVAKVEHLHSVETVIPWDVHYVPNWRGTPLISVIGGALCFLSPGISFCHWDMVFHAVMRRWLEDLASAGVDLEEYGKKEEALLRKELRGAFDADATESSRVTIRETMSRASYGLREGMNEYMRWNISHWVPIRLIRLKTGPRPDAWHLLWAPEFEHLACQFWELIERVECAMPGSWIED